MADGPMSRYRALVAEGALTADPAQALAVEKLQLLHQRLIGWSPASRKKVARGILGFGRKASRADSEIGGLYLFGGVGRGKSMLMDLFHETAPVKRRRRVHFHAFMQEVHAGVHFARETGVADPIPPVVDEIAESAALLCFDELEVRDIADAMILGRLFQGLFRRGVVVVATSNRAPDDLYKDGLNRQLFLPFIALLKERLDIFEMNGPTDHRLRTLAARTRWRAPLGPETRAAMDAVWDDLTGGAAGEKLTLSLKGRTIALPRFARGVGRADFDTLCAKALGPADYLAVARAVETLILDDVPLLGRARYDAARRFVMLIDVLYEAKRRLIVSAEAEPSALYPEGDGAFEFARTVSRLEEMRSEAWGVLG
jgi:cell division protein ZapE